MDSKTTQDLHIFFFPFMAQGHIIPLLDMAKLFAARGIKVSIITTPVNATGISESLESSKHKIGILIIKFDCVKAGLPEGCEHVNLIPSPDMGFKFITATSVLADPLEEILKHHRPNCLISDTFFPWSTEVATKCGVPRLAFSGTCFFATCAAHNILLHQPYKHVESGTDPFVIPNLPGEIKLTRNQLPSFVYQESEFGEFYRKAKEVELKSYGLLVNSFYELEPTYADYYRNVLGGKAWHIGPISLWNSENRERSRGRKEASISEDEILQWLNLKKPNSVVYVCFGSVADLLDSQLLEIANGLEESEQQFIWVVKKSKKDEEDEKWFPEGFEKKLKGKGLIIRGWAPQVMILEHEAVGGFVSHCGWNSTLEAITAGVPMVTWPVSAEQFYNEKLVTEILRIGVAVGAKKWARLVGDSVKREAIKKAIIEVMVDEAAQEMRCRANHFAQMARKAVEEGGSSYSDFNSFIEELKILKM